MGKILLSGGVVRSRVTASILLFLLWSTTLPLSFAQVTDGTPVNAANTNAAFLFKNLDDTALNQLTLNGSDPTSGPSIVNIQREFNSLSSFTGKPINQVYNYLPVWTNNDVGTSSDNLKVRIDDITAKFNATLGHTHTGAAGDAPQISITNGTTGILSVSRGGTGTNSLTNFAVLLGNGTTTVAYATPGSAPAALVSNGSGSNPSFQTLPVGGGGTGLTTLPIHSVLLGQSTSAMGSTSPVSPFYPLVSNGPSTDPSFQVLPIAGGGTGQITANGALNALLPTQTGSAGQVLTTDGSNASWAVATGGGGGGSLQWIEGFNSPIPIIDNLIRVYNYGASQFQILTAQVKIPNTYVAGKQIKLIMPCYSADNSGNNFLIQTIAYLIRPGTDVASLQTNFRTSTNGAITTGAGTVNIPQNITFDLTSSTGTINSISVAQNNYLIVELTRAVDTSTSDVSCLVYGSEITFN